MFDIFKLATNGEYRGLLIQFAIERALPVLLGILILLIGVAFILSGTKAASTLVGVAEIAATKGKSLLT